MLMERKRVTKTPLALERVNIMLFSIDIGVMINDYHHGKRVGHSKSFTIVMNVMLAMTVMAPQLFI